MVSKICIDDNVVEFGSSEEEKNLYRGGGVLIIGASLLIHLLNVSPHPWLLQHNHITPADQAIWVTIISVKGGHKKNPDYKDSEDNQGSSDSY